MVGEQLNLIGERGRDCPVCFRPNALHSSFAAGARVECRGCAANFRFEPATADRLATLVRIEPAPHKVDHYAWLMSSIERARVARQRLGRLVLGTPEYGAEHYVRQQALERARHHAQLLQAAGDVVDAQLLAEIAP